MISFNGYSVKKESVNIQEVKNELTVSPLLLHEYSNNIPPEKFEIYRESSSRIFVPRYYGLTKFGIPKKNTIQEGVPIDLIFKGTLRPIQSETVEATLKAYEEYGGGLVSLDTGLGKTVVALNLVGIVKKKTLIIVHAQFLLEQWIERIREYLPDSRIGIIRQSECDYLEKDIIVGMLQSIIKRDYPKECMESIGHIIIDEVHHIGSRTFSSIFFKVQAKYMLGLSATPERKDGLSKIIYWFLGPQIVSIKRTSEKPEILFVFNNDSLVEESYTRNGKLNISKMITELTLLPVRNDLIISQIITYLSKSRKILVLSHRRNHCETLLELLSNNNINAGLYLGGMNTVSRSESITKDVILGTYQASGEGFDVPLLDTLVLATPKRDVIQAVGRILRQKNMNNPLVIDIIDPFSIFKFQYYSRKKYYSTI